MSELHDKLRATVAELHAELAELSEVDAEARQMLESALHDIQQAMQPAGSQGQSAGSLTTKFKQAARHFEETHPNLTGVIGSVIDTLGRMGI